MSILKELGLTREEMTDRIVAIAVDDLLGRRDESRQFSVEQRMEKILVEETNKQVDKIAEKHLTPHVKEMIENIALQKTNKWGEVKGETLTFKEYLVSRADDYMAEKVDFQGKPRGKDSYGFSGKQSRIIHMVDEHLHWSIETAMKTAMANINKSIALGLQKTVKIQLENVLKKLK